MPQACEICLTEECKGKYNCNCMQCKHAITPQNRERWGLRLGPPGVVCSARMLKPTIRITRKCTQSCQHCCFTCSPKCADMMTVETAITVANFLHANKIGYANIMGGEFFCNPEWKDILSVILPFVWHARLVTNSDWAASQCCAEDVINFLMPYSDRITVALSEDKWHTNKNVCRATALLKDVGLDFYSATEDQTSDDSIVPTGRGSDHYGLYSSFATYCHKPDRMYDFLIDEDGEIYKCSFGAWDYANVNEYQEGGFAARFKEFNKIFYKAFVPSCRACQRAWEGAERRHKRHKR